MSSNDCFISGLLGRDPEIKYTGKGTPYCRFTVACLRKVKNKEYTDWVPVIAWGSLAEGCGNHLKKGTSVMVRGRFTTSSYDGAQGKKYFTQITADMVSLRIEGPRRQGDAFESGNTNSNRDLAENGPFDQFSEGVIDSGAPIEQDTLPWDS